MWSLVREVIVQRIYPCNRQSNRLGNLLQEIRRHPAPKRYLPSTVGGTFNIAEPQIVGRDQRPTDIVGELMRRSRICEFANVASGAFG
jgi:hypothetical protein